MTLTVNEMLTGATTLTCCNCGIAFAVPAHWCQQRRDDHQLFYCPNGHGQHFTGKSDAEKLREQLESQAKATAEAWSAYTNMSERKQAVQRQLVATRGVVTRTKKRVSQGKCPCCKAKFADLAAHMQGEHPGYGAETAG
jgi:phytoene dehydrogenase-like protein